MAQLVIPKAVRIRSVLWPVVRGVDLEGAEFPEHPPETKYYGIIKGGTIYLSAKILDKRIERVTFLHELMHACVSGRAQEMASDEEEILIDDIDDPMLRVLEALEWE